LRLRQHVVITAGDLDRQMQAVPGQGGLMPFVPFVHTPNQLEGQH
jgi:hypothetical protein